jgi:uncharacterized protein (TIGR02265 family)
MLEAEAAAPGSQFVFAQAVEGLFCVGLRGKLTPTLKTRLKDAGLDLGKKLEPAYPRNDWNHFIRITVEALYPGVPEERAYHSLGRQLLGGYAETLVGKALAGMLRLIGPKRTLSRMTNNFRSGGNYNLCKVTELKPAEHLFWLNEPELHPAYVAGILEAALELAGARGVHIAVQSRDAEGCTYLVRWESSP